MNFDTIPVPWLLFLPQRLRKSLLCFSHDLWQQGIYRTVAMKLVTSQNDWIGSLKDKDGPKDELLHAFDSFEPRILRSECPKRNWHYGG